MKYKQKLFDMLIAFCVCTTCITILEGIMGACFFPDEKLGYNAFFSPPIFGVVSVLFGCVLDSSKELTVRQVLVRRVLHLFLIEAMVFGLNYLTGAIFPPVVSITLSLGIALIFVVVCAITWFNENKSAEDFNIRLKEYQENIRLRE